MVEFSKIRFAATMKYEKFPVTWQIPSFNFIKQ